MTRIINGLFWAMSAVIGVSLASFMVLSLSEHIQQFVLDYGFQVGFCTVVLAAFLAKLTENIPNTLTPLQKTTYTLVLMGWGCFALSFYSLIFWERGVYLFFQFFCYFGAMALVFFVCAVSIWIGGHIPKRNA